MESKSVLLTPFQVSERPGHGVLRGAWQSVMLEVDFPAWTNTSVDKQQTSSHSILRTT